MDSGPEIERGRAALDGVRQLRDWTSVVLALAALAAAVACACSIVEYAALDQHTLAGPSGSFVDAHRLAGRADGVVLALLVVAGALFVAWMWGARQLTAALRSDGVTTGDAWVTLGWLPLFNLVVPFALTAELYAQSEPAVAPGRAVDHAHRAPWWLIVAWWLPGAAVALLFDLRLRDAATQPSRLLAPRLAGADASTIASTLLIDVVALALLAIAAGGAVLVVWRVTARLDRCYRRAQHPVAPELPQSFATAAASQWPR